MDLLQKYFSNYFISSNPTHPTPIQLPVTHPTPTPTPLSLVPLPIPTLQQQYRQVCHIQRQYSTINHVEQS